MCYDYVDCFGLLWLCFYMLCFAGGLLCCFSVVVCIVGLFVSRMVSSLFGFGIWVVVVLDG